MHYSLLEAMFFSFNIYNKISKRLLISLVRVWIITNERTRNILPRICAPAVSFRKVCLYTKKYFAITKEVQEYIFADVNYYFCLKIFRLTDRICRSRICNFKICLRPALSPTLSLHICNLHLE